MATLKKHKLEGLSKEDKLKQLALYREKKRRLKNKKGLYKPHEGQLEVHQCRKPNIFVFAGNGYGKTCFAAHEAMWMAKGYNPIWDEYTPVPANVAVVLDNPSKVNDVWLKEMDKWFDMENIEQRKNGKPYVNELKLRNGSTITFLFHQQEDLVFESIEVDGVIADEPLPRRHWIGLKRGGRRKGRVARYVMIGTPLAAPWLRTDIYDRWIAGDLPDHECFRGRTEQNKSNLAEGYLDSFSRLLTDKEKKIRLAGEFFDLDDLALAHLFKRKTHIINKASFDMAWDKNNPCVVAIDPHGSKPHVAVLLGVDKDNQLYYIKELKEKAMARDFARTIRSWVRGYRVIDYIMDSAGQAQMTSGEGFRSFAEVMTEEGIRVRSTTYEEKSDEAFIERIRDALRIPDKPNNFGFYRPKLLVVEGNDGIIKDMENVGWQKHRDIDIPKPKLEIREHDFLACVKYGLASNLHYNKTRDRGYRRDTSSYGFQKKKRRY
jgi:hypothetical protein